MMVSTSDHDLDLYKVYYSPHHWLRPINGHEWTYQGRTYEVFAYPRLLQGKRTPTTNLLRILLGAHHDGYVFRNYDGEVTLYTRYTEDLPQQLYEVMCCIRCD